MIIWTKLRTGVFNGVLNGKVVATIVSHQGPNGTRYYLGQRKGHGVSVRGRTSEEAKGLIEGDEVW